jgi:isopentenyl-diphosphate delta-isomerase type 1
MTLEIRKPWGYKGRHSIGKSIMTATESTALDQVILVDKEDNEIGVAEKLTAHQNNLLHRAFSIFIFRKAASEKGEINEGETLELLVQQRALQKYHTGGLWTNTCCSHPRPSEPVIAAANRRLKEEIGIETPLKVVSYFLYNAYFSNGLFEHELDHVLVGMITRDQPITPDPEEVHAYRWVKIDALDEELEIKSHLFTPWFQQAWEIAKGAVVVCHPGEGRDDTH